MKIKLNDILPIILFTLFIFSISYRLLDGITGYGDSPYIFPLNHEITLYSWSNSVLGESISGLLFRTFTPGQFPFLLKISGFDDKTISYFLFSFPLLITCLTIFYSIRRISRNTIYSYFSGLFIILNNFIFEQLAYWPADYFFNLIGLIILFYLTYDICINYLNVKNCFFLILNSVLIIHPFYLVLYIIYLILFFIFYHNFIKKIEIKHHLTFLGIFLIQSYWLIPFIYNSLGQTAQELYNGNQLPVLEGYIRTANYVNLFVYFNYFGTLSKIYQDIWHYLFYFGITIIIILILFKIDKKDVKKRRDNLYMFFLIGIFLIFFNFALGPNSKLTGHIWMWFFNNVPGFGFFRSFTKPLIVSLISTIFLFGIFIRQWKTRDIYKTAIISLGIICLIIINGVFFTGDLDGNIGPVKIPREYTYLNQKYFDGDYHKFNVVSYPNIPYESYIWSINKNNITFPQVIFFNSFFFSKPIVYNSWSLNLDQKNNLFKKLFAFNYNFKFYNEFDQDLSSLNIRYILIHKDLFNILDIDKKVEYGKYYQYFKDDSQYLFKEDNKYFALFENKNFQPLIKGNSVLFESFNPTKYELYIKNIKSVQDISFLESFHKEWKLYLKPNPTNSWCEELEYYKDTNIIECKHTQRFIETEDMSYLYRKPIFDSTHKIVNEYANGWTIDPRYIKANYSKDYYKENPDGSIDIELTLYFRPQSYFYLGLIISGLTLTICIIYLIYHWRKRTLI